ncbi:MAG: hypothetical protein Q9165_001523 [Trypethelium subeluteriae]
MDMSSHQREEHPEKEKGLALRVSKSGSRESSVPQLSGSDDGTDWTVEEEERLVRRGNALTDFFFKDVGITQDQFNIGQQLLSVGIVVLEIPSNYVLYRIGPSAWISGQIIAWLCESGFIPAGLYTITRWYKRDETSKRFAWFFIGNMLAQALSGIIAYGVLHMRGVSGLAGWQWLFLIEGLFTIVVGLIFTTFFPKGPANPTCYARIRYFNERESQILVRRVLIDDPTKQSTRKNISMGEIRHTFSFGTETTYDYDPDPVNGSWMALNARSAGERSITLAVFIMSANCSGIIGSQLFQQSDGPLYRTGWTVIIAVASVALFFTIWANVQYVLLNRRLRSKGNLEILHRY